MPRPIVPRKGNYRDDALAVSRIARALELDVESDERWTNETRQAADKLLHLLLTRKPKGKAKGAPKSGASKSGDVAA